MKTINAAAGGRRDSPNETVSASPGGAAVSAASGSATTAMVAHSINPEMHEAADS